MPKGVGYPSGISRPRVDKRATKMRVKRVKRLGMTSTKRMKEKIGMKKGKR